MEEIQTSSPSFKGDSHISDVKSFKDAIQMISLIILTGILSQNVYQWLHHNYQMEVFGLLVGLGFYLVSISFFGKLLYKKIDTPAFNISNLIAIALATSIGTFIPQHSDNLKITITDKLISFLQLGDIFHSWWYVSFFVMLAVGLAKISSRKKFDSPNIGFHLAHLSPILVLLGFWVDFFLGFRGIIKLEEGKQSNVVQLYNYKGFIYDSTTLNFSIRLDDFDFEKYQPDYRIQLWKRDTIGLASRKIHGDATDPAPPRIVASLPLEEGKIHHVYGTNMFFRMAEFYPDFEFEYDYPAVTDTIAAIDPGILVDLKTNEGDAFFQLRSNKADNNKLGDVVGLGASFEFYWELPDEVKAGLSKKNISPEISKTNRIVFEGKTKLIHFLTDGDYGSKPLKIKHFYPINGEDSLGFSVRFLMPDVAFMNALPSSKSDKLNRPVAKMEAWERGGPAKIAYIYPTGLQDKSGMFLIPGTVHFLALESLKDKETKFYKSDLSVVNEQGEEIKKQSVIVNEPMVHDGYRFYQSDYDADNPSYSGIGVSHEPGLMVIYLGFVLLVTGIIHMFYFKQTS